MSASLVQTQALRPYQSLPTPWQTTNNSHQVGNRSIVPDGLHLAKSDLNLDTRTPDNEIFDRKLNPRRPSIRKRDFETAVEKRGFSNPLMEVSDALNDLKKTKRKLTAIIQAPIGSRPEDILLKRTIGNFKSSYQKKHYAANTVIVLENEISCQLAARRLLEFTPAELRKDLVHHIEILSNGATKLNPSKPIPEPKIIFTTRHDMQKASDDELFWKKFDLNKARYLYFDRVSETTSPANRKWFAKAFADLGKDFFGLKQEIIGFDSYLRGHLEDEKDTKVTAPKDLFPPDQAPAALFIESPSYFTDQGIIPRFDTIEIKTNLKGSDKNSSFAIDSWLGVPQKGEAAETTSEEQANQTTGKKLVAQTIQDLIEKNKKRIIVRADTSDQCEAVIHYLKILDPNINIGFTNKRGPKFYNGTADSTKYPTDQALIDDFGTKYNVLFHCKKLDGLNIPADALVLVNATEDEHYLEQLLSPVRSNGEGLGPNDRRTVVYLKKAHGKNFDELLQVNENRHRKKAIIDPSKIQNGVRKVSTVAKEPEALTLGTPRTLDLNQQNATWVGFLGSRLPNLFNGEQINPEKLAALRAATNIEDDNELARIVRGEIHEHPQLETILTTLGVSFNDALVRFPQITGITNNDQAYLRLNHFITEEKLTADLNHFSSFFDAYLDKFSGTKNPNDQATRLISEFIFSTNPGTLLPANSIQLTSILIRLLTPHKVNLEEYPETIKIIDAFYKFLENKTTDSKLPGPNLLIFKLFYHDLFLINHNHTNESAETRAKLETHIADFIFENKHEGNNFWLEWLGNTGNGPLTDEIKAKNAATLIRSFLNYTFENKISDTSFVGSILLLIGHKNLINKCSNEAKIILQGFCEFLKAMNFPINKLILHNAFPELFPLDDANEARTYLQQFYPKEVIESIPLNQICSALNISLADITKWAKLSSINFHIPGIEDFIEQVICVTEYMPNFNLAREKLKKAQKSILNQINSEKRDYQTCFNQCQFIKWHENTNDLHVMTVHNQIGKLGCLLMDFREDSLICYYAPFVDFQRVPDPQIITKTYNSPDRIKVAKKAKNSPDKTSLSKVSKSNPKIAALIRKNCDIRNLTPKIPFGAKA